VGVGVVTRSLRLQSTMEGCALCEGWGAGVLSFGGGGVGLGGKYTSGDEEWLLADWEEALHDC
jgi:hypothetical protein